MKKITTISVLLLCAVILLSGCVTEPSVSQAESDIMTVPYMGTNGNIWIGTRDTGEVWDGYVPTEREEKGYILADTLAIAECEVFESEYIDTSKTYISFSGFYSGYHISSLTLLVGTAGTLAVSSAPFGDLSGAAASETKNYELTQGICEIDCDISVGDGETLVLGGASSTATVKVFGGITNDAGNGDVTVDGIENAKLCCKVLTDRMSEKNLVCCDTFTEFPLGNVSTYVPWSMGAAPFVYANDFFSGATINAITLPANSIKAGQTLTVSVVRYDGGLGGKIAETLESVTVTASEDATKTPLRCEISPLTVPEGYTLAFGKPGDTMSLLYLNTGTANLDFGLGFYHNTTSSGANSLMKGLAFEVYGVAPFVTPSEKAIGIEQEAKKSLSDAELDTLAAALEGKRVSILGDSISTYEGISNNTSYNATIGANAVWYNTSKMALDKVWWRRVMSATGMELCVNNSFSGSEVLANSGTIWQSRCVNLHSNEAEPDIILLWMGTNDYQRGRYSQIGNLDGIDFDALMTKTPSTFAQAYALSVAKMKNEYPDADIFCFSIMPTRFTNSTFVQSLSDGIILSEYNNLISGIAEHFDAEFVDLSETGFEFYNIASYTLGDALHPNVKGMEIISDVVLKELYSSYCGG